jgi:hypothetical protein
MRGSWPSPEGFRLLDRSDDTFRLLSRGETGGGWVLLSSALVSNVIARGVATKSLSFAGHSTFKLLLVPIGILLSTGETFNCKRAGLVDRREWTRPCRERAEVGWDGLSNDSRAELEPMVSSRGRVEALGGGSCRTCPLEVVAGADCRGVDAFVDSDNAEGLKGSEVALRDEVLTL